MEFIHSKGIVHRDLKPENLLLDSDGRLKIIDFGTAEVFSLKGANDECYKRYLQIRKKFSHESDDPIEFMNAAKPRKSFVGTVFYLAPEMLESQNVDKGCDFWALGIIVYQMLTGKYLFDDANEYWIFQRIKQCDFELNDELPSTAKDLIDRLLKKKPLERLGNGDEGSGNDIKALKEHPFFDSVDFKDIKEKRIVLVGKVKKIKYLFWHSVKRLVLYSNGVIEYFDENGEEVKERVIVDNQCKVYSSSSNMLHLVRLEKKLVFQVVDISVDEWIKAIKANSKVK